MTVTSWFDIANTAKRVGAKYPELVAAQWALESGWGHHTSGKNNFFGIKGKGTVRQTKEFINGKEITISDEFKDFSSPEECIQYLVDRWKPAAAKPVFPLAVPYYYQRDSKTGHGERSCQSSAIAMCIEYFNSALIEDDDDYLKLVLRYGDTVSQIAHKKALDSLGIKNQFSTSGTEGELIRILNLGCPVPIGILHRGSLQNPTGGGHYVTLIGYDDKNFHVHDPFGELDLVNGGYPKAGPTDGKNQRYSRASLMKRWLINSSSDGWYWNLTGNK